MNRQRPLHHPRKARRALGSTAVAAGLVGFQMPPKAKACGKRRCATYDDAVAYLLRIARKTKDPLRIYQCDACEGWHLTKRPEWETPS